MVYVDTSVLVALFLKEPRSSDVARWYAACEDDLVSAIWCVTEFASALSIKERSGMLLSKDARAAWRSFEAFCESGLRLLTVSRQAFREGARLARQPGHGLRAGDALHLAVVLEAGAGTIATLDTMLAANARRLKLRTVKFLA